MMNTLIRLVTMILVSGGVLASAQPANAQSTLVRLVFNGTGAPPGGPSQAFNGCVQYDSSLKGSAFYFDFTGNTSKNHEICYQTAGGLQGQGNMQQCEPYYIHTSMNQDKTFEVQATQPNTVTVTVTIPKATAGPFSPIALPSFKAGSPDPFSTNSGTFTLSDASDGTVLFTGTISTVDCSNPAVGSDCTCPTFGTPAPAPPSPVYGYSAPGPYPVYACPPRRTSCVGGLFTRLFHRNRCW